MTLPVTLSAAATADRKRLAAFLAENDPDAAVRAVETIVAALARLPRFPHLGRPVLDGQRVLSIPFGRSGYVALYRIDTDAILIARIFHAREDR